MPDHADHAGHADQVARYYDANTARFLRFGEGSQKGAIHRGVWMPEVTDAHQAADTINRLLIERLAGHVPAGGRILELGCGVGATMIRLARALDAAVAGITISRAQADIAGRRIADLDLDARCQVMCGDFAALPEGPRYHAMVGVESFIHAPRPRALLQHLAERLEPGGRVLLCDDWLTEHEPSSRARKRCLARFRSGWRVGHLQTPDELRAAAADAGLRLSEDLDLTAYLRLGRPRDRVIAALAGVASRIPGVVDMPLWGNVIGGSALQTALARGWLAYRLLVLTRVRDRPRPKGRLTR